MWSNNVNFCGKEEKMQLIEFWRKDSRFDFILGISNAISFEQWMNKLWWKTKTWEYTRKRNLKLFRPSSEILVHLKFRQHYKKCGAFCFKKGVNYYMLSLVSNYKIIHVYKILITKDKSLKLTLKTRCATMVRFGSMHCVLNNCTCS